MEENTTKTNKRQKVVQEESINPLRAEKISVRYVPREGGMHGDNPRHALAGGKAEGAPDKFGIPMLSSGEYKNPLTKEEKSFLEDALALEDNALSVYKTVNNFWWNYYVTVGKEGLTLDLSNPEDYIKYKVLLLNRDLIAPSLEELQDKPKQTYRYVLVPEGSEDKMENAKMDATMASYREFGKIENDNDTLRVLIELLDARPYGVGTTLQFLRSRANQLIQADPKAFLRTITDPMLHTKVIIRRGVEIGDIIRRNDFYYLRNGNTPMCNEGEDSTLSVAARWLNQPSHQDIKALIEAKVDKERV